MADARVGVLSAAALAAIATLWPRSIYLAPAAEPFLKKYYAAPTDHTIAALASTLVEAQLKNAHIRVQKAWLMRAQMTLLVLGLLSLSLAVLMDAAWLPSFFPCDCGR